MIRIAALVDHSVYATSVCDYAAWLSTRGPASIDIIHVVNPYDMKAMQIGHAGAAVGGPGVVGNFARHGDDQLAHLTEVGHRLVDDLTERAAAAAGALTVGQVVVAEWPKLIADIGATHDIVVIGKRGEGADFVGLVLGSTLEQVARSVGRPILAVPRLHRPIDKWLVAFSATSDVSAGLTTVADGHLLPPIPCTLLHTGPAGEIVSAAMELAKRQLTSAGHATLFETAMGPLVQTIATRMVRDDVGLLAIGGFHRTPLLPALFGQGTANELTRACLTPVLILR